MRGITIMLVFVLALNAIFFWGQTAVTSINPTGTVFFNYQGSNIQRYDQGNYTLSTDPTTALPSQQGSVSPTTGNIFTDAWSATQNWLLSVTGIGFLIAIVNTVPNFLNTIGLPQAFSFGIGYIWDAFSIFVIVLFIRGIVG